MAKRRSTGSPIRIKLARSILSTWPTVPASRRKLHGSAEYALGGIAFEGALDETSDGGIAQAVRFYRANAALPQPRFALVWTVADETGETIDQRVAPLTDPKWVWTAPNNPGNYVIRASLSDNGGESSVVVAATLGVQVPTPTFTPTPTPTNTPTPTDTPTPTPISTPTRTPDPPTPRGPRTRPAPRAHPGRPGRLLRRQTQRRHQRCPRAGPRLALATASRPI